MINAFIVVFFFFFFFFFLNFLFKLQPKFRPLASLDSCANIFNTFFASSDFCRPLITFANIFDPDQDKHVHPDLNPNRLTI